MIKLENNTKLPVLLLYIHDEEEFKYKKEMVNKLLDQGWIRPSKSPVVFSIIFTRRCNRKLCICINYRTLNINIVKDYYPLPLINEILCITAGAIYLIWINLRTVYWFIRMVKGEEWKMVFRIRYRLYKWCVIPFGLTNTLTTIQRYINSILLLFFNKNYNAYLDNILI